MKYKIDTHYGKLNFKGLRHVYDLISVNGPILSHFRDFYNSDIFFYWVDADEVDNRWLVFQLKEGQLYRFLTQELSLKDIMEDPFNNIYYLVDIGEDLSYDNSSVIFKDELPEFYKPSGDSIYAFNAPSIYSSELIENLETGFTTKIRENAIYFKLEPNDKNKKTGNSLGVFEASEFLDGIGKSLLSWLEYSYLNDNNLIHTATKAEMDKIKKKIKLAFNPAMVELVHKSFGVAISINTVTPSSIMKTPSIWAKEAMDKYENDVIKLDYKDESNIQYIVDTYAEDYRIRIFKPIIDLYNDKKISIGVSDGNNFKSIRPINHVPELSAQKILKQTSEKPAEVIEEKFARVKLVNGKPKTSSLTMFPLNISPALTLDKIIYDNVTYNLSRTLWIEYKIEDGYHKLISEELNISVGDEDDIIAEQLFHEAFHNSYIELMSKKKGELSTQEQQLYEIFKGLIPKRV